MTITNGYATVAEFRTRTGLTADQTANKTTLIEREIERNSRLIDKVTSNIFYTKTLTASKVRFDNGSNPDGLYMSEDAKYIYLAGDVITVSSVIQDGLALVVDVDYILGKDYIKAVNYFTTDETTGVIVAGTCGRATHPDEINEICLAMTEVSTGLGTYTVIDETGSKTEITRDMLPKWVDDRLGLFKRYYGVG
jgi:hypothetical protein